MVEDYGLIAPCGLHCGVCPVYLATEDRSLAEKLAQRMGVAPETLRCRGCRVEEGKVLGEPFCEN